LYPRDPREARNIARNAASVLASVAYRYL